MTPSSTTAAGAHRSPAKMRSRPEFLGLLKPVGHTLISFASAQALEEVVEALGAQGFDDSMVTRYGPVEMVSLMDIEIANAGVLAPFGYELAIAKAHRMQALDGCHFLLVYGPDEADVDRITVVAKDHGALSAQHYGRFLIQELTGLALGDAPVR